ncbi:adenylate kinase 8-like [Acyrthosiphon pisum]|uniref:Adenylate kinase 8 n=1 Tax=Acyrthosiphon pisum TaxID=7029 RepID=A0A8R2B282_ACYPI|nr:adenylate kinase 8-like [Acyrthosiphon pisum]|eukprot:XP_008180630.1 PREDICTED: adenylate kinase 8-like [Acyrthosiphon pisum]
MIKASQTCYLEKHRIYEMFRNVVKSLLMSQPPDPLRFIKRYLKCRRHVDIPKILLVAPPHHRLDTDKVYVALNIAKSTGVVTIDRRNVLRRYQKKRIDDDDGCDSTDFTTVLREYMRAKGAYVKGWILLDIPNSNKEAEMMISRGILPTHTIVLNEPADLCHSQKNIDKSNTNYKNLEFEIKMKFRFTLKEINVQGKSIDEITELCLDQIVRQKHSDVPFVPRVVVIGPVRSGRFIVVSGLSKRFNLVNVDFDQMMDQQVTTCSDKKIAEEKALTWLKEKLTQDDCVENGYVLKGFPRTRADFEWLDSTGMAPNRVIFLAISFPELYRRFKNRCLIKNTGTTMSLNRALNEMKAGTLKYEDLLRCPSNSEKFLCEFKTYCIRLQEMLYYCGDGCSIITFGESVCDDASACVVAASPAGGPRPQNHMPSRLTTRLAERILFSSKHEDFCRDPGLSEEARDLLNALERGAKRFDVNHGVDQTV